MKAEKKAHLRNRILFFLLGMVLFVAPFALFMQGMGLIFAASGLDVGSTTITSEPTVHRSMCLRMPLDWAVWDQETFIKRFTGNPLYGLVFVLIGASIFVGPLFCGWICPGAMTEHLSRLVPSRFKINLKGKIDPAAIRYGFLAGFFIAASPWIEKSICCGYCNWGWIENVWLALFGDFDGITGGGFFAFSSSSIITFLLTFGVLGVFMEGGRGWCNFMCPGGATQNLAHWVGAKLPFTYRLKLDKDKCKDCSMCVKECPTWALSPSEEGVAINRHVCNGCKDCLSVCHQGALSYERGNQ